MTTPTNPHYASLLRTLEEFEKEFALVKNQSGIEMVYAGYDRAATRSFLIQRTLTEWGEERERLEGKKEKVRHHESCLALGEDGKQEPNEKYCDCGHPDQWSSYNSALDSEISLYAEAERLVEENLLGKK